MNRLFHAPVAAFLAMMVGASPSLADGGAPVPTGGEIIINTDTGGIQFLVNGASLPATVTREGDVRVYTFHGDLVIPDDTVIKGTGGLGAAFRATNNAFIGKNVTFDFSAVGATASIGGGAGGAAEPEYINPGSAPGGQGNQIVCVAGICLIENRSALSGSSISPGTGRGFSSHIFYDTDGQQGPTGGAGAPGLGGGGGGAGGTGGEGGVGPAQFRELVTFGHPSDPAFIFNIVNEIKGLIPVGGAAAPDRGNNGRQGQDALPFVFDWMLGADGTRGADGTSGAGGSNNGAGLALAGGGGGGAGGSGGGGSGGNSGQFGFAGGGGGGGMAYHGIIGTFDGGNGGAGKPGADGGAGTNGIDGGAGGAGGGGGGAFEISAVGRIVVGDGTQLNANGGNGQAGQAVASANAKNYAAAPSTVRNPGGAGTSHLFGQTFGGAGGLGGPAGNGGAGGGGGTGGSGGGGAGGTVKLFGSVLDADGALASAAGGSGGSAGGNGRIVLGNNVIGGGPAVQGGTLETFAGSQGSNPHIAGGSMTPFIPDLVGGAELYGLLAGIDANDPFFDSVRTGAPDDALAAIMRVDLGPAVYADDYNGFDMLLYVNLLPDMIWAPTLGFDPAGGAFATGLTIGGWMNDPAYGGFSDAILLGLGGYSVFATLIPEVSGLVTAGGSPPLVVSLALPGGPLVISGNQNLNNGDAFFLVPYSEPPAAVPLPASLLLLGGVGGLAGLRLMRRT